MEKLGSPLVDVSLLPDFLTWQAANPGYTLDRHAYPVVQPDQFFAIASLLWPSLVRHEGGIFLSDGFGIPAFRQWFAQTLSLAATERVMNHRHMRDMLQSLDDAPREYQLCPEMSMAVEIYETDSDVEITFYVLRSE